MYIYIKHDAGEFDAAQALAERLLKIVGNGDDDTPVYVIENE